MNILILGDVAGPSGRNAVVKKLPDLIKKKKIDFVIVNGENAADTGFGITEKNAEDFKISVIQKALNLTKVISKPSIKSLFDSRLDG